MALSSSISSIPPHEYLHSIYYCTDGEERYEISRWRLTGRCGDAQPEATTFRIPAAGKHLRVTSFASIGSKIYMIGGLYMLENRCSTDISVVETQNLHTGDPDLIFTKLPSVLNAGVRIRNAVAIGGKIYTFPCHFGHRKEAPLADSRFEVFNPETETTKLLPEPPVSFPSNESFESYVVFNSHIILSIKWGGQRLMFAFDTAHQESGWKDITPESSTHNRFGGRFYRAGSVVIWDPMIPAGFITVQAGKTREGVLSGLPTIGVGVDSTGPSYNLAHQESGWKDVTPESSTHNGGSVVICDPVESQPEPMIPAGFRFITVEALKTREGVIPQICCGQNHNFIDHAMEALEINQDPFPFSPTHLTTLCATALGGFHDDGTSFFVTLELESVPLCHAIVRLEDDPIRTKKWYRISGIPQEMVGLPCFSHGGYAFFMYSDGNRPDCGITVWDFKIFSLDYVSESSGEYYAATQVFSFQLQRPMHDSLRAALVIPASN